MNLVEDKSCFMQYFGINFDSSIQCTDHRIILFMGHVPHKSINTSNKPSKRISHSSYTKTEHENVGLNVLGDDGRSAENLAGISSKRLRYT